MGVYGNCRISIHAVNPFRTVFKLMAACGLMPGARSLAHGPRDLVQLVIVLFPGGGAAFGGPVADTLAQAHGAVDRFPEDVRMPDVPGRSRGRVHQQRVQGGMATLLGLLA